MLKKLLQKLKPNYRKSVFIVTYKLENKKPLYLILKRKLHWTGWEFPKGGIEKSETLQQTIKRELKEETNLSVLKIKNHNLKGKFKYNKKFKDRPDTVGQTYKLFSAQVKKSKVKISKKEHLTYKWVDYKTAMKRLTWENQRTCLGIVDEFLRKN